MKGNTLAQFMNDLLMTGGPEKEYEYHGKRYFLETQPYASDSDQTELVIYECFGDEKYIFRCHGKDNAECVAQFERARIFDGKTIYEAEDEITVLFG